MMVGPTAEQIADVASVFAPSARGVYVSDDCPRGPMTIDIVLDGATEDEAELVREAFNGSAYLVVTDAPPERIERMRQHAAFLRGE
jgi:hypothetical protein